MRSSRFLAVGLAVLFVLSTSFMEEKKLYPECKYAVSHIIETGAGYIIYQGPEDANITRQTEGWDYTCTSDPFSTSTSTTNCRQVLELFNNQYMIVGWYDITPGVYQP